MNITPEIIKSTAVEIVNGFVQNKTPLSQGVASYAIAMELNSEQVKRIVEATNQLAYLKLLATATDRTFEFPVADYDQVMSELSMIDKTASVVSKPSPLDIVKQKPELEKVASEKVEDKAFVLASLRKEIMKQAGVLKRLEDKKEEMVVKLASDAAALYADARFLDKLALVADEEHFVALSQFVTGHAKQASEVEYKTLFVDKELQTTKNFLDLYKQAEELVVQSEELADKLEKAANLLEEHGTINGLEKEAFLGLIGRAVGASARMATAGSFGMAKKLGSGRILTPVNWTRGKMGLSKVTGLGVAGTLGMAAVDSRIHTPTNKVWDSIHK